MGTAPFGGGAPMAPPLPPLQQGDSAPPAGSFKETLHQACARTEGGIIFFLATQESVPGPSPKCLVGLFQQASTLRQAAPDQYVRCLAKDGAQSGSRERLQAVGHDGHAQQEQP